MIEGLENLKNLKILDLAGNKLKNVENLLHLNLLEDLWVISIFHIFFFTFFFTFFTKQLNDNLIDNWKGIEKLGEIKTLQTIYLEGNPISKDSQYRNKLTAFIPSLTQIDSTFATKNQITSLLEKSNKSSENN